MDDEIAELMALAPLDRVRAASARMDLHRAAMARLGAVRGEALLALRAEGRSAIELAEELGVSRQQVHRLMRDAESDRHNGA